MVKDGKNWKVSTGLISKDITTKHRKNVFVD